MVRIIVDGLHGTQFEATALDFKPARGTILVHLGDPLELASCVVGFVYRNR